MTCTLTSATVAPDASVTAPKKVPVFSDWANRATLTTPTRKRALDKPMIDITARRVVARVLAPINTVLQCLRWICGNEKVYIQPAVARKTGGVRAEKTAAPRGGDRGPRSRNTARR